jgi:hypothetical protein
METITANSMQSNVLTSEDVITAINKLWSVYGNESNEYSNEKMRQALIVMAQNSVFWSLKHLFLHCDHHNWFMPIMCADDPVKLHELTKDVWIPGEVNK